MYVKVGEKVWVNIPWEGKFPGRVISKGRSGEVAGLPRVKYNIGNKKTKTEIFDPSYLEYRR